MKRNEMEGNQDLKQGWVMPIPWSGGRACPGPPTQHQVRSALKHGDSTRPKHGTTRVHYPAATESFQRKRRRDDTRA